jgi:hypothetical protein
MYHLLKLISTLEDGSITNVRPEEGKVEEGKWHDFVKMRKKN